MKIFLNGKIVPESQAVVSVFDRSFLYGDGLFETLYVKHGSPFRWLDHWSRLARGAEFLGIQLPFAEPEAKSFLGELLEENLATEAIVRLTVSRGVGMRGYSPMGANRPVMVMTLHPVPEPTLSLSWRLHVSRHRLYQGDLLSSYKSANKLTQVMARAEAEAAGADEALLLDDAGHVVEAATGNLFWVEGGSVFTPPLRGVLPGVTRSVVLELCRRMELPVIEESAPPARLLNATGVFVSLSTLGVVPASSLGGQPLSTSPLATRLRAAYLQLLELETAG